MSQKWRSNCRRIVAHCRDIFCLSPFPPSPCGFLQFTRAVLVGLLWNPGCQCEEKKHWDHAGHVQESKFKPPSNKKKNEKEPPSEAPKVPSQPPLKESNMSLRDTATQKTSPVFWLWRQSPEPETPRKLFKFPQHTQPHPNKLFEKNQKYSKLLKHTVGTKIVSDPEKMFNSWKQVMFVVSPCLFEY